MSKFSFKSVVIVASIVASALSACGGPSDNSIGCFSARKNAGYQGGDCTIYWDTAAEEARYQAWDKTGVLPPLTEVLSGLCNTTVAGGASLGQAPESGSVTVDCGNTK